MLCWPEEESLATSNDYARERALLEQFHKKVRKGLINHAEWAYKSAGL